MYGLQYEDDLLLFLRLMKFLHTQVPKVVEQICKEYPTVGEDEIFMILEEVLWNIFDDVELDSDEFDETTLIRCSHASLDRLYALGREMEADCALGQNAWARKLHDIAEFFVVGSGNSVSSFSQRIMEGHVIFEFGLSPDCYEPLYLANAIVDMLLYCQCSVQRMEPEFTKTEPKTLREEAA